MWFALFDQEFSKEELLETPAHFKIGLKNLSFGKYRFWRWIFYGICQTLALQIIGFYSLEGGHALYDDFGQPSSLWVTGTHIYGMVVIMVNMKVAYSTHSHTIYSTLIVFLSIASFYVMFFIESQISFFKQLYGVFNYAMRIPAFYLICAFFILSTAFTERLLHWTNIYMT